MVCGSTPFIPVPHPTTCFRIAARRFVIFVGRFEWISTFFCSFAALLLRRRSDGCHGHVFTGWAEVLCRLFQLANDIAFCARLPVAGVGRLALATVGVGFGFVGACCVRMAVVRVCAIVRRRAFADDCIVVRLYPLQGHARACISYVGAVSAFARAGCTGSNQPHVGTFELQIEAVACAAALPLLASAVGSPDQRFTSCAVALCGSLLSFSPSGGNKVRPVERVFARAPTFHIILAGTFSAPLVVPAAIFGCHRHRRDDPLCYCCRHFPQQAKGRIFVGTIKAIGRLEIIAHVFESNARAIARAFPFFGTAQ